MSRWLVSHFAPFAGAIQNSSATVSERLKSRFPQHTFTDALPVSFKDCWQALETWIERSDFDGVVAFGQADRADVCLERVALNWIDATIPDEDGAQPIDKKIIKGAPEVLWTDLPVREWLRHRRLQLSYSAGPFVCNFLYFHLLTWANKNHKPALFVHVPSKLNEDLIAACATVLEQLP